MLEETEETDLPERFDDDYQYFLEVTQTPERNKRQAGFINRTLNLDPSHNILDAPCGIGRIAENLASQGLAVTGLDANPHYIRTAQENALKNNLPINYCVGDLRSLPWVENFDAAISWFISFGYFSDTEDQNILCNYYKALRPGGRLLIEHVYLPGFLSQLPLDQRTFSIVTRGKDSMTLETCFDKAVSRNFVTRTVLRDGRETKMNFSVRFYRPEELVSWLRRAGFSSISVLSKDGGDVITDNAQRIVFLAEKSV